MGIVHGACSTIPHFKPVLHNKNIGQVLGEILSQSIEDLENKGNGTTWRCWRVRVSQRCTALSRPPEARYLPSELTATVSMCLLPFLVPPFFPCACPPFVGDGTDGISYLSLCPVSIFHCTSIPSFDPANPVESSSVRQIAVTDCRCLRPTDLPFVAEVGCPTLQCQICNQKCYKTCYPLYNETLAPFCLRAKLKNTRDEQFSWYLQ